MPAKLRRTPIAPAASGDLRDRLRDAHESAQIFRTIDIRHLFNVSGRQLQWWDERGALKPDHVGHAREYSIPAALLVGVTIKLRSRGLSLQRVRPLLKRIERLLNNMDFPDYIVIEGGRRIISGSDAEDILDQLDQCQGSSCVIALTTIARRVDERLRAGMARPSGRLS